MLQKLAAKFVRKFAVSPRPSTRLRLERLESRLTPSSSGLEFGPPPLTGTYTNATVKVAPSLFSFTVSETITATVTNVPAFNPYLGGMTTPIPPGTTTPSGTVLFSLNNQMQSAQLDSSGQATVSFTLPLFAVLSSQTLEVNYLGKGELNPPFSHLNSSFLAPLYMNYNNLLFPATLTFGQLTPQQANPTINPNDLGSLTHYSALPFYNTAQGETNDFGIVNFLYTDPGDINQVNVLGFTLPGIFAAPLNAYGPQFSGQSSSSGSL
jgi:hypothetical protein